MNTSAIQAEPAETGKYDRPLDGHELDHFYGWASYFVLFIAMGIDFTLSTAVILTAVVSMGASGDLFALLRLTGWRFWAGLILAPAAVIALMSASITLFTWLTGAARPEDLGTQSGWLLFVFLIFGPIFAFSFAIERLMAPRKAPWA